MNRRGEEFFLVTAAKGLINLGRKISEKNTQRKITTRRKSMSAQYQPFEEIKTLKGNFNNWELNLVEKEGLVGIILGARGSGKSAIGMKILENIYARKKKKCYAMGFDKSSLPIWIESIEHTNEIHNNSVVLIDEGGILFSSRNAMTNANKILSELLFISRHKNLTVIFISQNSANLEINAIRQADFLILKPTALLQKEFERKKIAQIYADAQGMFTKYKDKVGLAYVYANEFQGFVANPLPSFWTKNLSKSFSSVEAK